MLGRNGTIEKQNCFYIKIHTTFHTSKVDFPVSDLFKKSSHNSLGVPCGVLPKNSFTFQIPVKMQCDRSLVVQTLLNAVLNCCLKSLLSVSVTANRGFALTSANNGLGLQLYIVVQVCFFFKLVIINFDPLIQTLNINGDEHLTLSKDL